MYNSDARPYEVILGEELTVFVLRGKGDSIISRMKDGRVILFNRENPIFRELKPGMMVHSKVSFIAQNYVIVDPTAPPESGLEAIRLGLDMVTESENWELAVLASAIQYILENI